MRFPRTYNVSKRVRETYHRLGEILVRKGVAKSKHIDEALREQRQTLHEGGDAPKLGDILVKRNILSPTVIREILEEQKVGRGEKRVLSISLRGSDEVAVLEIGGRLDESKQERVAHVFERLMNRGFCKVLVDCRQLVYLDSHGVSAFVAYIDEARARGGDVKFFGLNPDAQFTLDRLGLNAYLQTFEAEGEAVRAFDLPIDEYMSRGSLGEYVSIDTQKNFHLSYCPSLESVADEDKVYFESKKHARDAGKSACRKCRP
jgi:anti-anti-sigma factor